MTNFEKDIAIAEIVGEWEFHPAIEGTSAHWYSHKTKEWAARPPAYGADLNEMHGAEVYAIENIFEFDKFYWIKLAEVTKCSRIDGKQIAHSTAAQREEAFLKTVGKWKDQ